MKETLITEKIGGFEIVCGFGRAVIDPHKAKGIVDAGIVGADEHKAWATLQASHKIKVKGLEAATHKKRLAMSGKQFQDDLRATDEYKNLQKVKAKADKKTDAGVKALSDAYTAFKKKERKLLKTGSKVNAALAKTKEYKALTAAKTLAETEIKTAYGKVLKERKAILEAGDDIYFEPKSGEMIINDIEAKSIRAQLKALPEKTRLIKVDETTFAEIDDRRKERYWFQDEAGKWKQATVEAIDQSWPEGAVFKEDLTPEIQMEIAIQKEEARIAALTAEENQTEFDDVLRSLKRGAAMMKQEKEIEGLSSRQALKEARGWLAEQRAIMVEKYDIAE